MLKLVEINKTYAGKPLLRGISFSVQPGETICLLGASGSGKSTLLRIIAGLEEPESGRVLWNDEDLSGVPVHERNFGLMFQDYALFPHRSVIENVAFGLRMQGLPKVEIDRRAAEALERVDMADMAKRRVTDLSGGEQQRVALARALAPRPRLLMLDEPLAALDRALREQLGDFLRDVLHQTGIPAIYVTHDQSEAFAIADRLVLLHAGRIEQSGQPAEVYRQPASTWVADFLGLSNLLPGSVQSLEPLHVRSAAGLFEPGQAPAAAGNVGAPVRLLLYPSGWRLASGDEHLNTLEGRVEDVVFRGESYRVRLRCGEFDLQINLPDPLPAGQTVRLAVESESVVCLKEDDEPHHHH